MRSPPPAKPGTPRPARFGDDAPDADRRDQRSSPLSTGFPGPDAERAFARERRRQALARIAARFRAQPDDVTTTLPFGPVVDALGRRGERDLGVMTIPVGAVVGTVDRRPDTFDRS